MWLMSSDASTTTCALHVRIPVRLKQHVEQAAREDGRSLPGYIRRLVTADMKGGQQSEARP